MNRICKVCNINIDKNFYLKDRAVCKNCYNRNRRKNNNYTIKENEVCASHQQPKIDILIYKTNVPEK